ncbi:MAG: hypothetical protein OEX81_03310 [Candidatus Pacebacteria bacterium]|nr:hypothetical protein [Candidatus Paceibacterota bacterium]
MNKEKRSLEQQAIEDAKAKYLREISEKAERVKREIEADKLMLQNSFSREDDANIAEQEGIEPYPLSIFGTSELIGDNSKAGAYFKLTIQTELLLPDLQERFGHVEASNVEFDIWALNSLKDENKRTKILVTIAQWEKQTGLKVRFEGVVGK